MGVRVEMLEGRQHYVVPAVMIRAGTWSGSQGPVHWPADALGASVPMWNGRPVVIYHPAMNGKHISALDPAVYDRQRVGWLFNTSFDGDKLKAEAWIDVEKVRQVDHRVAAAIANAVRLNVSTGMFADHDDAARHDPHGRAVRIANHVRPDHLAILFDQDGACSLADGAGLFCNDYAAGLVAF